MSKKMSKAVGKISKGGDSFTPLAKSVVAVTRLVTPIVITQGRNLSQPVSLSGWELAVTFCRDVTAAAEVARIRYALELKLTCSFRYVPAPRRRRWPWLPLLLAL